jgi:hypothetical protein
MGAGSSTLSRPSKITSSNELLVSTKDVREMANSLFQFMYSELGDKEVYEMAMDPGKYVIALSDLITNKFYVLGYVTKRNQIGEIYFAKYTDLNPVISVSETNVKKQRMEQDQRENAMMIAFYYVRLFQILGSLLAVIKDLQFPILDAQGRVVESSTNQPGYTGRPLLNQGIRLPRYQPPMRGGGIEKPALGAYEFFRYYLSPVPNEYLKYSQLKSDPNLNKFIFQITPNLYFEYTVDPTMTRVQIDSSKKQKLYLLVKRSSSQSIEIRQVDLVVSVIYPENTEVKAPVDFSDVENQLNQLPRYVIMGIKPPTGRVTQVLIKLDRSETRRESYARGTDYTISDAPNSSTDLVSAIIAGGNFDPKKEFSKILERVILQYVRSTTGERDLSLSEIEKAQTREAVVSSRNIGSLKAKLGTPILDELYQTLKLNKSQPHCISRALQLLDSKSINEFLPTGSKTSICKYSIADKKDSTPITTFQPIKSLSQLYGKVNPANFKESQKVLEAFVKSVSNPNPSGIPLSVSSLKELQKEEATDLESAIKRLSKAFNVISEIPVDTLAAIQVSRSKACKTSDEMDVGSQPTALQLQAAAHQLMAFHLNQTIQISKFLQSIFDVKKDPLGKWKVNGPKTEYMFAGFPALETLTSQARELLVDYYSGCESIYQTAVKQWEDTQPKSTQEQAAV